MKKLITLSTIIGLLFITQPGLAATKKSKSPCKMLKTFASKSGNTFISVAVGCFPKLNKYNLHYMAVCHKVGTAYDKKAADVLFDKAHNFIAKRYKTTTKNLRFKIFKSGASKSYFCVYVAVKKAQPKKKRYH